MILYLQKNYNSDLLSISYKVKHKNEPFYYDYEELEQVKNTLTFKELYNYLEQKYNCIKLIIQF